MKRLLMSAAIAALAVPAIAQDTTTPETAAEEAVQATEEAADATADAAADAADATVDAADATADAAADAADASADAAADAADATADAADAATDAADAEVEAEGEAMEADAAATEEVMEEEAAEETVVAPTEAQPTLDASTPNMLASWVEGLQVYTTNQPSDSEWSMLEGEAIPEEWDSIADVGDIVIEESDGQYVVAGYVIDIGGFLGIGAKEVLISTEAMKMATFGNDVIFATNYTRDELGALPDFDDSMMMPATLAPADAAVDATADPAAAPVDPAAAPADPAAAPADPAAMPAEVPAEGEPAPASN